MLAHLIGLSVAFRDGAAKIIGPTTTTAPAPEHEKLVDDWREQLPLRVKELAEAWRDPAAWDGETTVGGVTMPAANIGGFGNNELVVHGWDLAVSTGQAYHPAEANLEASFSSSPTPPTTPTSAAASSARSSSSPTTPPSSTAPSPSPAAAPPGRPRKPDSPSAVACRFPTYTWGTRTPPGKFDG